MLNRAVLFSLAGLTVLSLQLVSASEEHHHHGDHEGGHSDHSAPPAPGSLDTLPYYFAHPDHKGLLYGHIALMSIGWIIILPIGKTFIVLSTIIIFIFLFFYHQIKSNHPIDACASRCPCDRRLKIPLPNPITFPHNSRFRRIPLDPLQ